MRDAIKVYDLPRWNKRVNVELISKAILLMRDATNPLWNGCSGVVHLSPSSSTLVDFLPAITPSKSHKFDLTEVIPPTKSDTA